MSKAKLGELTQTRRIDAIIEKARMRLAMLRYERQYARAERRLKALDSDWPEMALAASRSEDLG